MKNDDYQLLVGTLIVVLGPLNAVLARIMFSANVWFCFLIGTLMMAAGIIMQFRAFRQLKNRIDLIAGCCEKIQDKVDQAQVREDGRGDNSESGSKSIN